MAKALEVVADFTAEQWGMVTSAQAKAAGVDGVTLLRLVEAGLLERLRRGCYIVAAGARTRYLREKAVWLLLNPAVPAWERPRLDPDGGVVSHSSAALIHGIGDLRADTVEITVPRRRTTRESDVRLRQRALVESDVTLVDGLPITTVERTIVDHLDDHADGGHIGQMIYQAVRGEQLAVDSLAARIGQYNRRYGVEGRDGRALIDYLLDQGGRLADELARPRLARSDVSRQALAELVAGTLLDSGVLDATRRSSDRPTPSDSDQA